MPYRQSIHSHFSPPLVPGNTRIRLIFPFPVGPWVRWRVDLLTGQLATVLVCAACSRPRSTFDQFLTVSLPLPRWVCRASPNAHSAGCSWLLISWILRVSDVFY